MCMTGSYGEMRSPSYSARTSSPSYGCAHSLRIAIASSIPPSQASFFWKICINTRGWRPSASSVARAWLKYASVYQPARIFSTGRSKMSGSRRLRVVIIRVLQPQAGVQGGLGDLELLRAGLVGADTVLQLVPGAGECAGERMRGVARYPREDLRRRRDGPRGGGGLGDRTVARRRALGGEAAGEGRHQHRPDEVRAAALVLLRPRLAVLVAADRDVLGAVVGGDVAGAQGEERRCERERRAGSLARGRPETRASHPVRGERTAEHRGGDSGSLERKLGGQQRPLDRGQEREGLGKPRRTAQQRAADARGADALPPRRHPQAAVGEPDGAPPRLRAVHQHPVRERHASEPHAFRHGRRVARQAEPQTARAACVNQRTPSSRSATGTRSSAEWMSRAAVSASSTRAGKKP